MNSSANTCYIALGGNQGNVVEVFQQALQVLNTKEGIQVGRASRIYQTDPVGDAAGDVYTNAAAELLTTHSPLDLLHLLQEVEKQFGRTRPYHWAPRTLDLDVIFYEDQVIRTSELTVPHPASCYRRFVLAPLTDIAPEFLYPELSCSVKELLLLSEMVPYRILISGTPGSELKDGLKSLLAQFEDVEMEYHTSATDSVEKYGLHISLTGSGIEPSGGVPVIDVSSMATEEQLKSLTDILYSVRGRVTPI